jgi:hypothetical protein
MKTVAMILKSVPNINSARQLKKIKKSQKIIELIEPVKAGSSSVPQRGLQIEAVTCV